MADLVSFDLSACARRIVDHADSVGLPPDKLVEIALVDWVSRNNLGHILLAHPKTPKPAPRPVGRPPKARALKKPATVLGLLRNETAGIITFEVQQPGLPRERVRFSGWRQNVDPRIQLAPLVPVSGMLEWDHLLGRTISIKSSLDKSVEGTILPRDPADILPDLDWIETLDLDDADRAALSQLREAYR